MDPDLRELRLALERAERGAALRMAPGTLARVDDEPALPLRHEPVLRLLEARFRDHASTNSNHGFILLEFESVAEAQESRRRRLESGVVNRFTDVHGPNVLEDATGSS
jgi:hypothetical protein